METTLRSTTDGRAVIEGFYGALMSGDEEAIQRLVHPDLVMHWPQSGETFSGRERALAAMESAEVKPQPAGAPQIVGDGNVWVFRMPVTYGEDPYHYVGIFELEDGQVRRATEYFAQPFEASEKRRQFADPPSGTDAAAGADGHGA